MALIKEAVPTGIASFLFSSYPVDRSTSARRNIVFMKEYDPVYYFLIALICLPWYTFSCNSRAVPADEEVEQQLAELLVFTKTEGFRHASIPNGVAALKHLADENGWQIEHTEESGIFTSDSLNDYTAVIFLNTTGDILNTAEQAAFEDYIQRGQGFMGIHSATDTEYDWAWYGQLVGAYFNGHPQIQEARLEVLDPEHPSTVHLPETWTRSDEWYNFKEISPDINVLMLLDETSYQGGTNGDYHPAAWYHEFDGGRVFYTAGGHTPESYESELFLGHLEGGIRYVIGRSD